MNTAGKIVYCAGPDWTPEEVQSLNAIERLLADAGFKTCLPHRDGIEGLLRLHASPPLPAGSQAALRKAAFALEVYQIVERCHALVFNMNGRAPDEGGVFKTALAFAAGKPLVIYKNDNRSVFHGNDNSMVTGLTPGFVAIRRLTRIPHELARAITQVSGKPDQVFRAPVHLRAILDMGRRLWDLILEHRGEGQEALRARLLALAGELAAIPYSFPAPPPGREPGEPAAGRVVYCSGPLFCPEELGVMAGIARALEDAGCRTFLPQRDGVEAFVMNQVNSPLANAWIFKSIRTLVNKAVFALDIYQIIVRADGFVFNMNGRVPDEGGVVEAAVAFACGKPLVIYRNDARSLCSGREHSLIMEAATAVVDDIDQIPDALISPMAEATTARTDPAGLVPRVRRTVDFGRRVWKIVQLFRFLKPRNALLT